MRLSKEPLSHQLSITFTLAMPYSIYTCNFFFLNKTHLWLTLYQFRMIMYQLLCSGPILSIQ